MSKKSISLSQAIQTHITGARNQTTLGLAVKLHHRHGSSELIKDLHQHGFVVSYDEVLRFRKSAADFVMEKAEILHRVMGLETRVGIVCGWFDNLGLQVCTPNGRRDTHAMAHKFQLAHPAGIIETGTARPGISSLIVPRIKKQESARQQTNVDTTAIKLLHYTGKKQMDPPALSVPSVAYTDVCAMQTTLHSAQEKDMQWLNTPFLSSP